MTEQVSVWFDSNCPLCQREIALMERLDRHGAIRFIDACDPLTVCPIDRGEILSRFHAREGEKLLSGAVGFAAMWRHSTVASARDDRRLAVGDAAVRGGLSWLPAPAAPSAKAISMKDRFRPVPQSGLGRLAAFGQLAGSVATGMLGEGLRWLAQGERPHLADTLSP